MRAKQTYHHGNLSLALIEVASELVEKKGPGGWSFSEAARIAGVTHAAAYKHFSNQQALLNAVTNAQMELFAENLKRALNEKDKPMEKLFSSGKVVLDWAQNTPNLYLLSFGQGRSNTFESIVDADETTAIGMMIVLVQNLQSARFLSPAHSPAEISLLLWSCVHGLASLAASGRVRFEGAQLDAQYKNLLEILVRGLTP